MNYYEKIKNINAQIFSFVNYKKLCLPLKIACAIAMIPMSLISLVLIGLYYLTLVVYYCIKSPLDYLQNYIREEGKEVKHATQFIIYFIAFPTIFFANVILSIISIFFFIYNLLINIFAYLATLGGIDYIPFLFDTKERNNDEIKHMGFVTTIIYASINFVLFIVTIATSLPLLIIVSIVFSSIFLKFSKIEGNKKEAPLLEQEDYE